MELFNLLSTAFRDLRANVFCFTVPKTLWNRITYANYGQFLKVCSDTMKEYYGGMPCGVSTFHNWHSNNPMGGNFPHVHMLGVNVVFMGKKGDMRPVVAPFDLDLGRVKSIYKKRLSEAFGVEIKGKINLHYQHVPINDDLVPGRKKQTNRELLVSKLLYCFRMPQKDITEWSVNNGVDVYTESQKNEVNRLIFPPKSFRRTRHFGWWADGVRAKYLKLFDLFQIKREKGAGIEPVVCPLHNAKCDLHESFVHWEDVKDLKGLAVDYHKPPPDRKIKRAHGGFEI